MTQTKPPEENYPANWPKYPPPGFVDWIDAVLQPDRKHEGGWMYARRDAAQLRAKAAAYDEAMRRLNDIEGLHDEECPWRWWGGFDPEKGTDLDGKWYKQGEEPVCQCPVGKAERFVAAEIAAKRFTP